MLTKLAFVPDTAAIRKARGAFFTPDAIAEFIINWAVRSSSEVVLEPSCGEAAFLTQAVRRLLTLQAAEGLPATSPRVDGVEIHAASAEEAERLVRAAGGEPSIITGDFFLVRPEPRYTAVVGNPPFIRYQDFAGEARTRSREAALRAGINLSGMASSWAAFTIQSALMLKRGGRLGLVVPAELFSVNYASDVRRFLFSSFARLDLVVFTERVFPEVQEEVVLVLADGYGEGAANHASIYQAQNASALSGMLAATTWAPDDPSDKWTPSLLSSSALGVYSKLLRDGDFAPLETWGDTTLGMVTGNNKYFSLSPERAAELRLSKSDLLKLSPPGSRHLRGLEFSSKAWEELGEKGSPTYLFRPGEEPSEAARRYIAAGEEAKVDASYKCRVRKTWWQVPLLKPADLFVTYMNADTPRIVTNEARTYHLNSVHGIYLRPETRTLGRKLLPVAALTSMTLVGAETVGRSYGGGMLKLEPREADLLPVPSVALVEAATNSLVAIRPQLATHLRYGRLTEAARLLDGVLLVGELGMKRSEVKALRDAHAELSARRSARSQRVEA